MILHLSPSACSMARRNTFIAHWIFPSKVNRNKILRLQVRPDWPHAKNVCITQTALYLFTYTGMKFSWLRDLVFSAYVVKVQVSWILKEKKFRYDDVDLNPACQHGSLPPAGIVLQVAGCGLKFNYNWKTAGNLEERTSCRLTVTVTWPRLWSLSKIASTLMPNRPKRWEESILQLDIAFAKCQQATIQILIGNLKKQSCFVHVTFFVAKYSKQRQMS